MKILLFVNFVKDIKELKESIVCAWFCSGPVTFVFDLYDPFFHKLSKKTQP